MFGENWWWHFAFQRVIITKGIWHVVLQAVFNPRSQTFYRHLQAGSVNAFRLTQRAADKWDSHRQKELILHYSNFRQCSVFSSLPLAANANRWALSTR